VGAKIAKDYLLKLRKECLADDVYDAILSHRFSKGVNPVTTEAKILQDADALDALGAIGLYRTIAHSVEHNKNMETSIEHFYQKLFLLPNRMHFKITKKMAKERIKIMRMYVKEIERERQNIANVRKELLN